MTQTVTLPDGTTHNFPDEATPDMIAGVLGVSLGDKSAASPTALQNKVGVLEDVAKSTGSNLVGGGIDIAMTLPNLINQAVAGPQLLGRGVAEGIHSMLGTEAPERGELWQPFYSSYDVEKTLGTDYEPQTTSGKAVALPSRIVGGIAGAKGLQKADIGVEKVLKDTSSGSQLTKIAPSADLRAMAKQKFETAGKQRGLLDEKMADDFVGRISKIRPQQERVQALEGESEATALIKGLQNWKGKPISFDEADELDKLITKKLSSPSAVDKLTGKLTAEGHDLSEIQHSLREVMDSATNQSGFKTLGEARKLWAASMRQNEVERILERASMTDNPQTAIKTGFRTLASNKTRMRGFSPEEQAAIKRAAKTGILTGSFKLLGSRLISSMTGGMAGAAGGGPIGAGVGMAGGAAAAYPFREAAAMLQKSRANDVRRAITTRALNPSSIQPEPIFPALAKPLGVALLEGQANRPMLPLEDLRQKLNSMR